MRKQIPPSWKLPSQCVICHAWPADSICSACWQQYAKMQLRCQGCALLLPASDTLRTNEETATQDLLCGSCAREPLAGIDACHAAVSYAWPWQQYVDDFKFAAQTAWAHTFARVLLQNPHILEAVCACDFLIPMPLHPLRLAERGFNQSLLLAKALRAAAHQSHALNPQQAQLSHDCLLRIRHTPKQSQLPLSARMRNVHKAFAIAAAKKSCLLGKHVVLVDDVMTSSASVLAAAHSLKNAGVERLDVVVFARTEKH